LKDLILWEIGLIAGQRNIADDALGELIGERIDNLAKTALAGRHASYGIVRLMRALARLGVPVSLTVTPATTMLRTGERKKVIRYREPTDE
jgi:hypothetical protein